MEYLVVTAKTSYELADHLNDSAAVGWVMRTAWSTNEGGVVIMERKARRRPKKDKKVLA